MGPGLRTGRLQVPPCCCCFLFVFSLKFSLRSLLGLVWSLSVGAVDTM